MKHLLFKSIITFWQIFPAKKFLSEIIKSNKYLKSKLYKDLRFQGNFTTQLAQNKLKLYNPGFTTIENEIFWNGIEQGWEKVSLNIWIHFVSLSSVIIDIGANSGIYSLIAGSVNKNAEIHAFEPVSRTNVLLTRNIELNQFSNIHHHEMAVSNETGESIFYDFDTDSQYSASLNEQMLQDETNRIEYKVQVVRLDEFYPIKHKKIDLIKIDVEMHEFEVLLGMGNLIERNRPIILIEILTDSIGAKIENLFSGLSYLYFNIDELNIPNENKHLVKSNHYNYLLLPIEKLEEYKKVDFKNVI